MSKIFKIILITGINCSALASPLDDLLERLDALEAENKEIKEKLAKVEVLYYEHNTGAPLQEILFDQKFWKCLFIV